ncbi:MAG: YihY/virulence factor BrkB family protein [Pedobacter sp.]|nr:MAG: YihY/virulence factor BrkB family protein [Pedobacter sp.]
MKWLHRHLLKFRPYSMLIEWTKVCVLPGFSPLPLYTVATFFFREVGKEALVNKASSLAYNFMLAIFPGIIFLFTLIPYIPKRIGFQEGLMSLLALVLPTNAFDALETTIDNIVNIQNGSLLSIGFFLSMFFATNGVHNLMIAFNKSSLIVETRSLLKRRLVALILTMVLVLSMIVCIAAMTLGVIAINYLKKEMNYDGNLTIYGELHVANGLGKIKPVVILVHGSGPNNRHERLVAQLFNTDAKPNPIIPKCGLTLVNSSSFDDIVGYFTTRGVSVLTYDKRSCCDATKYPKCLDCKNPRCF